MAVLHPFVGSGRCELSLAHPANPQSDIQTVPWPTIVHLINEVKKHNPVTSLSNGGANALATMVGRGEPKAKLDAHDIAK